MQNDDNQKMRNIEQHELATKADELTKTAQNQTIVITDDGAPLFYCVPAKEYETMLEKVEDVELAKVVKERADEPEITVNIEEMR